MSSRSGKFFGSEAGVIWMLWMTYGAFYFCRTNISAAVPGMEQELGFSKTQIGFILGSLKITYGIGQFINGQLAERFSARYLLAAGMFVSAALNVVFGFGASLYFLLFIWACNGYFQSLGWPPSMRVAANWFGAQKRGRAIGIVGTGYQVTAAITFVVAGLAANYFGWRAALYVPALLLALAGVHMLVGLRESPDEKQAHEAPDLAAAQCEPTESAPGTFPKRRHHGVLHNLTVTLANPGLWFLGASLALLNACRYGFLDWGIAHLVEVQGSGIGKAGINYAILPIGGIAGALVSGWATDRFFGGRRIPVIVALLVVLGILALLYHPMVKAGSAFSVVVLCAIGFAVYGPQVLLVGTAPIDFAKHGTAAAAVGFVNFMGYIGAFSGDQITGALLDRYNWSVALMFWSGCAFGGAAAAALLWNSAPNSNASPRER